MMCVAPSEVLADTQPALRLFGLFAEARISRRYLIDNGRDGKGYFPPSLEDYTDRHIRRLAGNIRLLTDFVQANNPHVDVINFQNELRTSGRGAIPDILTHLRFAQVFEWYEIKPNSNSGRQAGRDKLDRLDRIAIRFTLPYVRGNKYQCDVKIRIWRGIILGVLATAYLHFFLSQDGLIVYEICVDGDFSKLGFGLIILAIATIIIFILSRGTTPSPVPILPPPGTIPVIPIPIPKPVPVSAFSELGISNTNGLPVIRSVVGLGATNSPNDVRAIQRLLNDWLGKNGSNLLPVDGRAGPKTLATLAEFQRACGFEADGVAEPFGPTIQMLVANHLNTLAAGVDNTFIDDMHLYRPMILEESPDNNIMIADYLMEMGNQ